MSRKIELNMMKRVGMTTDETEAYGKFNEQLASPLFSKLPRELRDLIWAYSTAPYEDPDGKFNERAYYYRPGHTARLKSDTALLLTCRRIWLEANAMPMLQAEHSFYFHRAAPDARNSAWMSRLTDKNRRDFGHLHMFAQMFAIERLTDAVGQIRRFFLSGAPKPNDFQPRMMHVTIRHTDWWFWENEEPLRLSLKWVQALLNSPDLRNTEVIKLELETLDYKVDQLEPILEQIRGLQSLEVKTHLIDGKPAKIRTVRREEGPKISCRDADMETFVSRIPKRLHPQAPAQSQDRYALQCISRYSRDGTSSTRTFLPAFNMHWKTRRKAQEQAHDDKWIFRWRTANLHAQWVEASRARMMEDIRKRQFDAFMGQLIADKIELRWKEENSLLKLGEDTPPAPLCGGSR
ncbi:hypothetical protein KC323_g125 [Hortaea werneckii]|nr:hypothetical protein KC323_g125 [Hortaea werneckii]